MKLFARSQHLSSYEEATSLFPSSSCVAPNLRQLPTLSEATALNIRRLQRIQRLAVGAADSRNGHRYFSIDVEKYARHPGAVAPSYHIHVAHATLRELRAQLSERASKARTSSNCAVCTALIDALTHDHIEPSRLRQLAAPSAQETARMESLLTMVLDHATRLAAANAAHCVGCEWAVKLTAELLRQPYEPSTGLI